MVAQSGSIIRLGMAFACALLCGSCGRSFDVIPSGFGTNVRLAFAEREWFVLQPKLACVSTVTVSQEKWPTRASSSVVWEIVAKDGCVELTGVDIGHVPDGFREKVNKLPLKVGQMYGADILADPYGGGSMPWFTCRQAPAIVAWKDDSRLHAPPANCGNAKTEGP